MPRGIYVRSPEAIEKIRQANLGNKYTLGYKHTPEAIEKIRQSHLGNKNALGYKKSPEVIEKTRQAHLGKKMSPETCEKQRQSQIKRYEDPLEREKTRQANLNIFSALERLVKDKYCPLFNNKLKQQVRERDNHICQKCGKVQNGRKHTVHHIHYDKKNCYPDLITLCNSCNIGANSNRDYWEAFYMNKLNERDLLLWTRRR